jgi:hypothetical protein
MKHWFEKVGNAFFSVVILGFALSFILTSCKSKDDIPAEEPTELTVQRWLRSEHLLSLAVCRVYDGTGRSLKTSDGNMEKSSLFSINRLNTDEQYPSIRYEFDFLKIDAAIHFLARGVNFPFLNEICGKGEIEVFLTGFNSYVYADETKDENRIRDLVSDGLIVFRGELGIYSCMLNSGGEYAVYSSHKRFAGNAVEKNFTPPLYEFYIKTENKRTSLACNVVIDKNGNYQNNPLQWTNLQGGDVVSSDKLFSTVELSNVPEISLQCTITGIGEDYFLVSSESNLEKLFFDEYTLFFADEQPAKSTDFVEGDMVTVTFDRLFERYNPKVALANKIEK